MSGIVGTWNIDGEPASLQQLLRMNETIGHRGPDGTGHLVCGAAAFAFQRMNVTPESLHETQPRCSPEGVVAMFDGRLDDRGELISRLKLGSSVPKEIPDVDLVLHAYQCLGEGFAASLNGDFALSVFDPNRQRLLLARDAMGARALYFCRVGAQVLFASEIKALLAHPAVETRLNEASLAEFLFSTWDHRDETNTLFSGIFRVPSANLVLITPAQTVLNRYFDFDTTSQLRLRDQAEYVEAYKEGFSKAVRRRLRSAYPTAITVSGGLDSSSIFCMAHVLSQADSRCSVPLPVGLVVEDEAAAGVKAGEWEFQQAVQEHCSTEIIRVPAHDFSFHHDSSRKVWHAEGLWVVQNSYEELYRRASQKGARVLLAGEFGDNLLMSPQFLLDQLLSGRWLSAWRSYRGFMGKPWFQWDDAGPDPSMLRALLVRELRSFLIPELVRPLYRLARYRWLHRGHRPLIFSDRFLRIAADVERRSHPVRCRPGTAHAKAIYLAARSKNLTGRIEMDGKAASMFSMDQAFPYRDKDLVQLVMSMPGNVVYPQGDSRGIHREAMRGILPEVVRLRRTKADFTRLGRLATLHDVGRLQAIAHGMAMQLGLLKPMEELEGDMRLLLQNLKNGDDRSKDTHVIAWNLLALEDFLGVYFEKKPRT